MKKILSTTSTKNMYLNYRMPSDGKPQPIQTIFMPSRGLYIEVNFPDENHWEEFKRQHEDLFQQNILFEGTKGVKGDNLQAISKEQKTTQLNAVKTKIDKQVEKLQGIADESNINFTQNVELSTTGKKKQ